MKTLVLSVVAAAAFAYGAESRPATGPAPPNLNQPGADHPMPIPDTRQPAPPDVRRPKHETGKEKPVASKPAEKKKPKADKKTRR